MELRISLPVSGLGPAQLAAEAPDDGFKAPVLDLKTRKNETKKKRFDAFSLGKKQELKIVRLILHLQYV